MIARMVLLCGVIGVLVLRIQLVRLWILKHCSVSITLRRCSFSEYVCTLLVAGGVSTFSLSKVRGWRGYAVETLNGINSKIPSLKIDGIKDIIVVASGKGGVGKSTTAGTFASTPLYFLCSLSMFFIFMRYRFSVLIFN